MMLGCLNNGRCNHNQNSSEKLYTRLSKFLSLKSQLSNKFKFNFFFSENNKVSNYIINSKPNGCYKIGENVFDSLQGVIKFYTDSLLDTTTLKKIVVIEKVRGKYDFPGRVSVSCIL